MEPPKPKPPAKQEDLAEVERAISALQGRHPEYERSRREDHERRAKRSADLEAAAKADAKVRQAWVARRVAMGAAAVVAVLVLGVVVQRQLGKSARAAEVVKPWLDKGLVLVDRTEGSKLDLQVPAGCYVALGTKLTYPGGNVEGKAPLMTCLCEGGAVSVLGENPVLFRAENAGGSKAFAFLPFTPGAVGASDAACAEAELDAWLDAKAWKDKSPVGVGDDSALTPTLKKSGFKVLAVVKDNAPFALIDLPADSCTLLLGTGALRAKGGQLVMPAGENTGWCSAKESPALLALRESKELVVVSAPAQGGRPALGDLRDVKVGALLLPDSDHGWNARKTLLASSIPESVITSANTPDLGDAPEARVVALSMEKAGTLAADTQADVFSFCDPQLDKALDTICVFSGPQKWRLESRDSSAGIARAKLPFWLFALQTVNEPAALKVATQLIQLARKLRSDGFEPTTIEAMTEQDKGVEVLGRANEDAMVALGLAPVAPYVFPYTDGPTWSLDEGEPRVVPIKPMERVTVTSTAKTIAPKTTRRSVVFRRRHF